MVNQSDCYKVEYGEPRPQCDTKYAAERVKFFETDTLCDYACFSELRTAVAAPCRLQLCVVLVTQLSTKDVTITLNLFGLCSMPSPS
jgi:hypothetical protein